jgi:hypothetical protein
MGDPVGVSELLRTVSPASGAKGSTFVVVEWCRPKLSRMAAVAGTFQIHCHQSVKRYNFKD